jgi:hypothetical protein
MKVHVGNKPFGARKGEVKPTNFAGQEAQENEGDQEPMK